VCAGDLERFGELLASGVLLEFVSAIIVDTTGIILINDNVEKLP
jgi:hypothetical protein